MSEKVVSKSEPKQPSKTQKKASNQYTKLYEKIAALEKRIKQLERHVHEVHIDRTPALVISSYPKKLEEAKEG